MNQPNPTNYLDEHLYNELRWLLCAAAEWHVQDAINLGTPGYYVQVYAMDSAAVHARALFEFFTKPATPNHLGLDLYGLQPIPSQRYSGDWVSPLHAYLMHAQDRSATQQLTSFDGNSMKHLKEMPVDFGHEVVDLWRQFIARLQGNPLAALAQTKLDKAIEESALVFTNEVSREHGLSPIAW